MALDSISSRRSNAQLSMLKSSQSRDRFSEVGYGEDLSGGFHSVFSIASMRKKLSSLRSCTYVGGQIIGLKGSSF